MAARYNFANLSTLGTEVTTGDRGDAATFSGEYRPTSSDTDWKSKLEWRREGEVQFGRGTGDWFDSATTFAAGQVRYELLREWHALAEYRWLDVEDGGTLRGFLAGVDRDIGRNVRIGVGYNFTDFSDDLTDFDYDHKGWFVNFMGRY